LVRPIGLIVFLSDFGLKDPYVPLVHAVIERVSQGKVRVIDLTHEIEAFSVVNGAYMLYTSYKWFPPGTVFLGVVDPGVGTERKPVIIVTEKYFFVGPNNGLLWPAAREDGIRGVYWILRSEAFIKPVSKSFHGRDVFAPVAALLAMGVRPDAFGPRLSEAELVRVELKEGCEGGRAAVVVVHVDRFGNVALGLEADCLKALCGSGGRVAVSSPRRRMKALCEEVFSRAEPGELVLYVNSLGFPELAVNMGDASRALSVKVGEKLVLEPAG